MKDYPGGVGYARIEFWTHQSEGCSYWLKYKSKKFSNLLQHMNQVAQNIFSLTKLNSITSLVVYVTVTSLFLLSFIRALNLANQLIWTTNYIRVIWNWRSAEWPQMDDSDSSPHLWNDSYQQVDNLRTKY